MNVSELYENIVQKVDNRLKLIHLYDEFKDYNLDYRYFLVTGLVNNEITNRINECNDNMADELYSELIWYIPDGKKFDTPDGYETSDPEYTGYIYSLPTEINVQTLENGGTYIVFTWDGQAPLYKKIDEILMPGTGIKIENNVISIDSEYILNLDASSSHEQQQNMDINIIKNDVNDIKDLAYTEINHEFGFYDE